ncbi:MAG: dTMP kinase, partial [Candidatus Micrarchaeota archaeon]
RQFIKPNKVILLDIPSSISFERKKRQKQLDRHEADKEFLERVRQNFLKLYEEKYMTKWVKIDANKSIEEVYKQIRKEIKN